MGRSRGGNTDHGQSELATIRWDVVVTDPTRTEEFYREGPLSSVAAGKRQAQIVKAIQSDGLDPFLRRVQIEESRIGPVSVDTPSTSPFKYVVSSVRRWFG